MSAILRHRHPNRFTVLPNDAIRNPALSFRAVGVLAHLLSLPDGAKVDSATLARAHKEGRDAVRSAFSELAAHGYYRREVIRLGDGTLRTEVVVSSTPMSGERAGGTDDGKPGAGPGPDSPAPVDPTSADPTPVTQAATEVPRPKELFPPQPPRPAGGPSGSAPEPTPSRPPGGRRAAGTNPRAEADRAEVARLEAEVVRRQAELEARTEARRIADRTAQAETDRLEAEAYAISAALDDALLEAVVARVRAGLSGLLAGSAVAVTRAVIGWCRAAGAARPGSFAEAVTAGLAEDLPAGEGHPPLDLPAGGADTPALRTRVAAVLRAGGTG